MEKRISAILQVIFGVLVLALIGGIIAVFLRFTNGGTTDFATFYVEYNGKEILSDTTIKLKNGEKAVFVPRYTAEVVSDWLGVKKADTAGTESKGFNVKIVPNITTETKFDYTVGESDNTYRFEKLSEKDFSGAFGLNRDDTSFVLQVDNFSVSEFIATKYDGQKITPTEELDDTKAYFNLIISSYDEKSQIVLGLTEDKSITIKIDGKEFAAEKGMTLGDFEKWELCGADIYQSKLLSDGKQYDIYDNEKDGNMLTAETVLEAGKEYYAVTYIFSFTLDGETYHVKQNTTWLEWLNSNDNTNGYYLSGVCIAKKSAANEEQFVVFGSEVVLADSYIKNGAGYEVKAQ